MASIAEGASLAALFASVTDSTGSRFSNWKNKKKLYGFYMHYDSNERDLTEIIKSLVPKAKIINIDEDVYTVMEENAKTNLKSLEVENPDAFENLITPIKHRYVNMIRKHFNNQAPIICVISHDLSFLNYLGLRKDHLHCLIPDDDFFKNLNPSEVGLFSRNVAIKQKEVPYMEYTSVENLKKQVKVALGLKKKK
jgi:hypothetical protein